MNNKFKIYLNLCHLSPIEFCVLFACEKQYYITGDIKWTINCMIDSWKLHPPSIFTDKQFFPFRYDYTKNELKDAINSLIQKNCMYFYDKEHIQAITVLFKKTPVLANELEIPEESDVGISPLGRIVIQHLLFLLRSEEEISTISSDIHFRCDRTENGGWLYLAASIQAIQFGLNINKEMEFAKYIKECGPWLDCWWNIVPAGYAVNIHYDSPEDVPPSKNSEPNIQTDEK